MNINEFLGLISETRVNLFLDNTQKINEKMQKLEMLRQQVKGNPHLVNDIGQDPNRLYFYQKTSPLMLAFSKNLGAAARILLEAGADMRQNIVYNSYGEEKSRNAFDAFLDSDKRDYDKYTHAQPDEILPIIIEFLKGLEPQERRAMFEKAADGKYYILELADVDKKGVIDANGDEQTSLFERLAPLGASLDIIPKDEREKALGSILSTNLYKGGVDYFSFLKKHVQSLEGGEELWRSMFVPGGLAVSMHTIHASSIKYRDVNPKKKLKNTYSLFQAMLNEVPNEGLEALFVDKVENNRATRAPLGSLVDHAITNRKYASATDFSKDLAPRLKAFFENIYPTLNEDQKEKIDKKCREMFGRYYNYRIRYREKNPLYQVFRKQVEKQIAEGRIPEKPYGGAVPKNITEAAILYSDSDKAESNVQEALVELHRERFHPKLKKLTKDDYGYILDEIAKWDKHLPPNTRGFQSRNLHMQVSRRVVAKYQEMNDEKYGKRKKTAEQIAEMRERHAPYRNGYTDLCSTDNVQFIADRWHGPGEMLNNESIHVGDHVRFDDVASFFMELGFYLGELDYELAGIAQRCFEDIVLYAKEEQISLAESLAFFKTHYPRQEIINVKDTISEISRYIYQPTYVIQARKAGITDEQISEVLSLRDYDDKSIYNALMEGLTFRQIVDNSMYWHMRRASVIGPAPTDSETGKPITEAVRRNPPKGDWKPLFDGDVEFNVRNKTYRFRAATSSKELHQYGSSFKTCVGGESFVMDCMEGRQQVYGLFEIDTETGSEKQKGYVRFLVKRSADSSAFAHQLKEQIESEEDVVLDFVYGKGMAINGKTAIQADYTTGHGNYTHLALQEVFDEGLKHFARAALQKGRDDKVTLPEKEREDDGDLVLVKPEEMLGLDNINHEEALRIFKLLEKNSAAVYRNKGGYAVDAVTGDEISSVEALYEGDRRVVINEEDTLFRDFQKNRQSVAGYSKMDGLQQFMAYTGLGKSIESSIEYAKKRAAKTAKGEGGALIHGEQKNPYNSTEEMHYYTDIREMRGNINRKLKKHRGHQHVIPQIFGTISVSDTLEAVRAFAKAYPEEVKIEPKRFADETKIHIRKDDDGLNLDIIASYIIAKRGISVPFLGLEQNTHIEYMPENMRWLKECKPLSEVKGIEGFVASQIGEAPGIKAFQSDDDGKTFFAMRPTSMDDMELAINFSQNPDTFPALIWGIPHREDHDEHGDTRPQWLVTPQFQKELQQSRDRDFHTIDPPKRVKIKTPAVKLGEDRGLEFARKV